MKNINKLKSELNIIRLRNDQLNNYTLIDYSNRNPNKMSYNKLINNAISDLYLLTDDLKLNVLKDFWIEEGRFFEYYDIARRCRNYSKSIEVNQDFYVSILMLFNGFFEPQIECNSKNLDHYFLSDLTDLLLVKRGAICRFLNDVKAKYFPNTFIEFLGKAKTSENIGHMIREIEGIKKLHNQFIVRQSNRNVESFSVQETENPVIFNEVFLNSFYLAFRDDLWNDKGIEDCENWFRVKPIGLPDFKKDMTTYFCYAVYKIKDKIIVDYKPKNFNNWIKPTINGNNFSTLKNRKDNMNKINQIDTKLSLIK